MNLDKITEPMSNKLDIIAYHQMCVFWFNSIGISILVTANLSKKKLQHKIKVKQ